MELLVVRHAIAEDREAFARTGRPDEERPLTDAGRKKFEKGARGLLSLVPAIDLLASSPLVRAEQTAGILTGAYGRMTTMRVEELAPASRPAELLPWLQAQRGRSTVAVVGHEPHLSALVEHLLVGKSTGFLALKKGGACLLSFARAPAAGGAELRWLLTAGQLRQLAR
jgi:phosphohistidine phosphatase